MTAHTCLRHAVFVLVVAWSATSAAAETESSPIGSFIKEQAALMERGFRDEDWPAVIGNAHEVLVRIPGEPTALKWAGLSLARLNFNSLAVRSLRESLRQKEDAQARAALSRVSQRFTTLEVRLTGVPAETKAGNGLAELVTAQLRARAARLLANNRDLDALPDAARVSLQQHVKEIEDLGGVAEEVHPSIEPSGQTLRLSFPDVELESGAARVTLPVDCESLSLESFTVDVPVRPGAVARAEIAIRELPSIVVSGLGASEVVLVDEKPTAGADQQKGRVFLKPGVHRVVRQLSGRQWRTTIDLKPAEKRSLITTDASWPKVRLVGLKTTDTVSAAGTPVVFLGDTAEVEPGEFSFLVRRGAASMQVAVTAVSGKTTAVELPAVLRLSTGVPSVSLNTDRRIDPLVPRSGVEDFVLVKPGVLSIVLDAPRRQPTTREINAKPGEDVTIEVATNDMPLTPAWAQYETADGARKRTGWLLTGLGAALAAGAGVTGYLWSTERTAANGAYVNYQQAGTLGALTEWRGTVTTHDVNAKVWMGSTIGGGAVAAALVTFGLSFLLRTIPLPEEASAATGRAR